MGARLTGKIGAIFGVTSRTTVSVALTMTDGGAHTLYTLTNKPLWDSNIPPTILVNAVPPAVAYIVDYIDGSVTFASALAPGDVVTVNNIVYCTMIQVGDCYGWNVNTKLDTADATAFGDVWHTLLATFIGWSVTIDSYHVNGYWFGALVTTNNFYVHLFTSYTGASNEEYFVGNGYLDDGVKVAHNAVVTEPITLNGTGVLKRKLTP